MENYKKRNARQTHSVGKRYVLDYHLTPEDIVGAIQQGIKQSIPIYEIKEIE